LTSAYQRYLRCWKCRRTYWFDGPSLLVDDKKMACYAKKSWSGTLRPLTEEQERYLLWI
jgi:hypothetical protein